MTLPPPRPTLQDPSQRYLLYDYLQVAGGAERLSLDLARALPETRLVVSRVYPEARLFAGADGTNALGNRLTKPLGRIPEAIFNFRWRSGFLRSARSVIYSGFYAPLAVASQARGARLYYCHTPPRFAYDLLDSTMAAVPAPARPCVRAGLAAFRRSYEAALGRMDCVLANSENVRARLQRFLGIEAEVVHPPIDTGRFRWLGQADYFVSLARLMPYKRVERIVRAFLLLPDQRLVVASGGPELERLRSIAAGSANIAFTDWLDEDRLRDCVGHARAAIYVATDEDFGMSPVEAMAAGKPVIGVDEGGLRETVLDARTGFLLPADPSPEHIAAAVRALPADAALAMRAACETRAADFAQARFISRIGDRLAQLEAGSATKSRQKGRQTC